MQTTIDLKEVEISVARKKHIEELQWLFKQLVPDCSPEKQLMESVIESLDSSINKIFIAVYRKKVIGSAQLIIYENLIRVPYKKAMIDSVIVDQKYRNQGVGTKLIHHILEVARQKNITKLYLFSAFSREKSFPFYKYLGFEENGLSFYYDF